MVTSVVKSEPADLRAYMGDNPAAVIEDVARQWSVSPRDVIEALPPGMARLGPGDAFVPAMNEISTWGEVTLIVHTEDAIFEFTGELPAGEIGRGYFNLMQPKGLHGHLKYDNCSAVAFVERPFMGKASAFVALLNQSGGIMFKVFVGRDANRELRADQMEKFRALASRFSEGRVG